jgi:hypothetical protein
LEDKLKKNSDEMEKIEILLREYKQIIHKKEEEILLYQNKIAEQENNLVLKENKINFFIEKYANKKEEEKYYDYNNSENINNRFNENSILLERSNKIDELIKSNNLLAKEKEELEAKIIFMKSLVSEISQRMEIEAEKQKNMNEEIADMLER